MISRSDVEGSASLWGNNEQMAAFEARVTRPMAVEKTSKHLRFDFGFDELFVARLVAHVIFAVWIELRDEENMLPIRRPDSAIGLCRDGSKLTRLAGRGSGSAVEALNPYL